jgi:hypothetical protein
VGLDGVIAMDRSCVTHPTVRVVFAETEPIAAVMVAEPMPELVARPCEPVVLLITATVAEELVQVTFVVMFFVLWSE